MKVVMILLDGMRPDSLVGIEEVENLKAESTYTLNARTVFPSVTLPCHMSLFHSVEPTRHGVTTNVFTPQVRPIKGLCEVLTDNDMKCDMYYSWSELQDIVRPGSLNYSYFLNEHSNIDQYQLLDKITDNAISGIKEYGSEFSFVYIGIPDTMGHLYGWMSDEYLKSMKCAWAKVEKIIDSLSEDYTVVVLADHGGHDRIHGTTEDSDMTIPVFIKGKDFESAKSIDGVNIIDIAPTICKVLGVKADKEWEGKSLL